MPLHLDNLEDRPIVRPPLSLAEARAKAARLTFDKDLANEIANLLLGCVWTERNECARVARDSGSPRIEALILERNRSKE